MTAQRNPALAGFTFEELHAECEARAAKLADVPDIVLIRELDRRGNQVVVTVRAIADYLGCHVDSVIVWSKRNVDPLPVVYDGQGKMRGNKSALAAWYGRHTSKIATRRRPKSEAVKETEKQRKTPSKAVRRSR
jgi:hypothetical protein